MSQEVARKMIVVTAPSGAGKTTIVRHLLDKIPNLCFSVSATTREQRANEVQAKDYYFLTLPEFQAAISKNEFIEWEEVYKNTFYGTLKKEVDRIWEEGKVVVFDVDVKGAMKIKKMFGDACLSIFIQPPSLQTLIDRLKARKTEDPDAQSTRIKRMQMELTYADKFDTIILNDHLTLALREAVELVRRYVR